MIYPEWTEKGNLRVSGFHVYEQPGICHDGCGKKRHTTYGIGRDEDYRPIVVYCYFCIVKYAREEDKWVV